MKSTAILGSLIAMVMLCACENSNSEIATQQLPSHMQSTEGRLSSAQGKVVTKYGAYYFSPNGSIDEWLSLDKQQYAKQFAGQTVRVRGFFNYDAKSITVVSIQAVASGQTQGIKKSTAPRIQK